MSFPKLLLCFAVLLFTSIFFAAYMKKDNGSDIKQASQTIEEIEFETEVRAVIPEKKVLSEPHKITEEKIVKSEKEPPDVSQVEGLFKKGESPYKFIETIVYKSHVPWQKGRPAWLSDYAAHYETSRHFIARSLNGKIDYLKQDIQEGDKFNAFKKGVDLRFHLLIDASRCKLWLYAIDNTHHEKHLLKTYSVCLGRPDSSKPSGLLTPIGKYSLGNRIAIYKPKVMGYHNGKKIEMVRVFGSRWIPFDKEIAQTTSPAKGFGLHGVPWIDNKKGDLIQDKSSLGKYESDGCIRLSTEDIEEIFSIIITKPATIEIVKNFWDSKL